MPSSPKTRKGQNRSQHKRLVLVGSLGVVMVVLILGIWSVQDHISLGNSNNQNSGYSGRSSMVMQRTDVVVVPSTTSHHSHHRRPEVAEEEAATSAVEGSVVGDKEESEEASIEGEVVGQQDILGRDSSNLRRGPSLFGSYFKQIRNTDNDGPPPLRPALLHSSESLNQFPDHFQGDSTTQQQQQSSTTPLSTVWDLPTLEERRTALSFHNDLQGSLADVVHEYTTKVLTLNQQHAAGTTTPPSSPFATDGTTNDGDEDKALEAILKRVGNRANATRWDQASRLWIRRVLRRREGWVKEYSNHILPFADVERAENPKWRLQRPSTSTSSSQHPTTRYYTQWPSSTPLSSSTPVTTHSQPSNTSSKTSSNVPTHHHPCFPTVSIPGGMSETHTNKKISTIVNDGPTTFVKFSCLQLAPKSLRVNFLDVSVVTDGGAGGTTAFKSKSKYLPSMIEKPRPATTSDCLRRCVIYNEELQKMEDKEERKEEQMQATKNMDGGGDDNIMKNIKKKSSNPLLHYTRRCNAVQMLIVPGSEHGSVCWLLRVINPQITNHSEELLINQHLRHSAISSLDSKWRPYARSSIDSLSTFGTSGTFEPHFWPRTAMTTFINRDVLHGWKPCYNDSTKVYYPLLRPFSSGGGGGGTDDERKDSAETTEPPQSIRKDQHQHDKGRNKRNASPHQHPPVLVNMLAARSYLLSRVFPSLLTWVRPFDTLVYLEAPSPHHHHPSSSSTYSPEGSIKKRHPHVSPSPPQPTTAPLNPLTCMRLNALMVALLSQPTSSSSAPTTLSSLLDSTLTRCSSYIEHDTLTSLSLLEQRIVESEKEALETILRPLDCGNYNTAAPELTCTKTTGAVRRIVYLPEPTKGSVLHGKGGGWKNQHIVFFLGLLSRRREAAFPDVPVGVRAGAMGGDSSVLISRGGGDPFGHYASQEYLWYMIVDDDTYYIPHNLNLALGSFILNKNILSSSSLSTPLKHINVARDKAGRTTTTTNGSTGVDGSSVVSSVGTGGHIVNRYAVSGLGMSQRSRWSTATMLLARTLANISSFSSSNHSVGTSSSSSSTPTHHHHHHHMILPLFPGCITKSGHCSPTNLASVVQRTPAMTGFVMSWAVTHPMSINYLIRNLYNDLVSDPTNVHVIPNYYDIIMTAASERSPLYKTSAGSELTSKVRGNWYSSYVRAEAQRFDPPDPLTPLLSGTTTDELINSYIKLQSNISGASSSFSSSLKEVQESVRINRRFKLGMRSAFVHGGAGMIVNSDAVEELAWGMSTSPSKSIENKKKIASWFCGIVGTLLPHGDVRLGFCATKRGISMRRFPGVYYEAPDSAIRKGHTDRSSTSSTYPTHSRDTTTTSQIVPFPLSFHRVKDVLELDGMLEAVSRVGGSSSSSSLPRYDAFIGWDAIYDRYDTEEESTVGTG